MRVLSVGIAEQDSARYKDIVFKNIDSNYSSSIIIDTCEDLEDADYCLEFRRYDLVLFQYNSANYKKYINTIKIISDLYEIQPKIYFLINDYCDDWQYTWTRTTLSEKYKLPIVYNTQIMNEMDMFRWMAAVIESFFVNNLKCNNLELDPIHKTLKIGGNGVVINLKIDKDINYKILSYFIKHYGQTVTLNQLMSAVCEEPEEADEQPIKDAIQSLRPILTNIFSKHPIFFNRVECGYQFVIA